MFKDNVDFIDAYTTKDGLILYMPSEITNYHKSREMAMQVQDNFSRCGISPDVLQQFADKLIEFANKQLNLDTLRTDIGLIGNVLKARMSSPVDELCALRMGAIACFMDGEDPKEVKETYTRHKLALADKDPDLYSFFLHTGIAFTPEYSNLLRGLTAEDYLLQRAEMLRGLTPSSTQAT